MKPITALAVLALIFCQASAIAQQGAKGEDDANAKREAANTQRYWLRYVNRLHRRFDDSRFLVAPSGLAEAPAPDGLLVPPYHDLADCERDLKIREKIDPPDGPISNWTCVPISITFKTYNSGRAANVRQQNRHQQQPQQQPEPYGLYGAYLWTGSIRAPSFLSFFTTTAPFHNTLLQLYEAPVASQSNARERTTSGITILRTMRFMPEVLRFPESYNGECCWKGYDADADPPPPPRCQ